MNLDFITKNIVSLEKKFKNKEGILDFSDYKILGTGEITTKLDIKAKSISESAKKKIETAGGKVIIPEIKKLEPKKSVEVPEKQKEEQTEKTQE